MSRKFREKYAAVKTGGVGGNSHQRRKAKRKEKAENG
jgi:hypothetical protein